MDLLNSGVTSGEKSVIFL